jgi:NAD+ kinase
MRIAIFGKTVKEDLRQPVVDLLKKIYQKGIQLVVHEGLLESVLSDIKNEEVWWESFKKHEDLNKNIDFVISIGGDGTFLECVSLVRDKNIPIIGINTGRMGFLADIALKDAQFAIDAIINQDFRTESRKLLELIANDEIFDGFNFALNELTIHKKDSASMITIKAYINGQFINSYWADGLILATPTGSTAYSLSTGGPIVVPDAQNFIITPLAPHNLTIRPIVVPDNSEITLKVEGRSHNFLVSLDSRSVTIDSTVELKIRKADFCVNLLKLKSYSFYNTLRSKLMWGLDMRN